MRHSFATRIRVRTYELDSFGHVNNAVYLNYFEEARSEFLKQVGLSFSDFARLGVQLVIVEAYVRYVQAARYGDEIEVALSVREMRPASVLLDYRLTEGNRGILLADGWTRGAFVDATTGKPTRAPKQFVDAFRQVATDTHVEG